MLRIDFSIKVACTCVQIESRNASSLRLGKYNFLLRTGIINIIIDYFAPKRLITLN